MILLFGHDKTVADWYVKKWGNLLPWQYAIGILDKEGLLCGAAIFHNYNGSNIEFSYYGPHTITKTVVLGIAYFTFKQLKVNRVTVSVPRRNRQLVKSLPPFGFKMEGVLRHFYGPYRNDDALVFGMIKSEAERFL